MTLKSVLQQYNSKASILRYSTFSMVQLSYPYMTSGKTINLTITLLTKWCLCFLIHYLGLSANLSRFVSNMPVNLENSAVPMRLEKVSFHSNTKEGQCQRCSTTQLHSCHMLARSCWKSSKLDFNSMWTKNFQMSKLDLEKAEEPEIKLRTSAGS